jgi:hypothetical protein
MLTRTPPRALRRADQEELKELRREVERLRRYVHRLEAAQHALARRLVTPEDRNREQVRILKEALARLD